MKVMIVRAQAVNFTSDEGEVVMGCKLFGIQQDVVENDDQFKGHPTMQEFIKGPQGLEFFAKGLPQVPGFYDVNYVETFSGKGKRVSKLGAVTYIGPVVADKAPARA